MELGNQSKRYDQRNHNGKSSIHAKQEPSRDRDLSPDASPIPVTNAIIRVSTPPSPDQAAVTVSVPAVKYRECLKNHAANMGGHVVDGCGEFMPDGDDGTAESMICAACKCHRNFHRKEIEGELPYAPNSYYKNNGQIAALPVPPRPILQQRRYHPGISAAPVASVMMNFGGGSGAVAESSSDDLNIIQAHMQGQVSTPLCSSKKRFRTKFSEEQREKMMEFAEKIGWKMQKQDDQEVQLFCSQLGVKRKVFKVWMHNNKQAMKRRHQTS